MLIKTDNILIPKPGPRARRGIRDSRGMSSYDARFHQTFQCLSLNVKGLHWERDLAEHEIWLHNRRRHQVEAGVDRALERGSKLRIPRRSEVHVEEQLITCKYKRMINRYFLCLTEMRLWFVKTVLLLTLSGDVINIKKKMTRLPPDQATADWIVKICSRVELMANRSPRYLVSQTRRPASQLVRAKPASQ